MNKIDKRSLMTTSAGSTFRGMSPIRWAKTSSTITLVLFQTYACSMQTVGTLKSVSRDQTGTERSATSAIIIRRKALAMEASTPTKSNSIDLFDSRSILTCKFYLALNDETKHNSSTTLRRTFLNFSKFQAWSS